MKRKEKKQKSFLLDVLEVVGSTAIIVFLLINFVLIPCKVDGDSMYPTLKDKDFGYSFVCTKNIGVNRFDICVLDVGEKLIVKRVIGLPGDTIEYNDNQLYINGIPYDEPYLVGVTTNDLQVNLGEDEYFCLGDNRNVSKDSRFYGAFTIDDFVATNILVLLPFENFGVKK